jgi:hypothetical protein
MHSGDMSKLGIKHVEIKEPQPTGICRTTTTSAAATTIAAVSACLRANFTRPRRHRPYLAQLHACVLPQKEKGHDQTVCVAGLVAAHQHNGKAGTVCSAVDQSTGRVDVTLDGGGSLKIKPFNLVPISTSSSSAPFVVFISGATGYCSAQINGGYDRTKEMSGGYPVYERRCDASWCIEHRGGMWQVKHVSLKGKDSSVASVPGGCALEACTSRKWKKDDGIPGHPLLADPGLKMVTGAEAERAVSGPCVCAARKS